MQTFRPNIFSTQQITNVFQPLSVQVPDEHAAQQGGVHVPRHLLQTLPIPGSLQDSAPGKIFLRFSDYFFAIIPRLHSQFSEQVYRLLHADCACLGRGLVQGRRPVRPRRGRGPRGRLRRGQEGLDSVASNLYSVYIL